MKNTESATTHSQDKPSRIIWIDILKVICIGAMILLHISAMGLSESQIGSAEWQFYNVIDSLCRFCVPVFVMISGSIFLNRKYLKLKKYIVRILAALVFWSITYTLFAQSISMIQGNLDITTFLKALIYPTHLWFLYMILGIYIIIPLLQQIVSSKSTEQYYLLLWLVMGIILPAGEGISIISPYIKPIIDQLHFHFVLEYSGYFVLGHYIRKYSIGSIENHALLLFLTGTILTIIGTWYMSAARGSLSETFYNYLYPTTLLSSLGIFIIIKNAHLPHNMKHGLMRIITLIAEMSLGIYAIHMFYLIIFHKLGVNATSLNPIIYVPSIFIMTVTISFFTIYIIRKYLPFGKRIT